ncbi:MAG: site-specific DNA-methyltransferase [Candidatus Atribacteria bacterium]|nr:MAG: site-specific DNA-methyltransferase [Candidatus Atribacteria bacterium]
MAERINKLNGKEWLKHSFSIWKDIQKNKEEWALKHPAMFPIMLAERLINIFTNSEKQVVLDPFMGSGSTLIAAQNKGLKGVGFEINKEYISMAKNRLDNIYRTIFTGKSNYEIINNSAIDLDKHLSANSIDLTITSPPYWDVLNRKRSADRKSIRSYSNSNVDFGNINNYDKFLSALQDVFKKVYIITKLKRYCIVILMDIRKKSNFYPFHSDLAKKMNEINFTLKDIIIWDRQKEYNNMRPLGYPYSFVVNKVHEYILIFQKD